MSNEFSRISDFAARIASLRAAISRLQVIRSQQAGAGVSPTESFPGELDYQHHTAMAKQQAPTLVRPLSARIPTAGSSTPGVQATPSFSTSQAVASRATSKMDDVPPPPPYSSAPSTIGIDESVSAAESIAGAAVLLLLHILVT